MQECLGEHSCMSSPYPIATLNGTLIFSRKYLIEMVEDSPVKG